MARVRSPNRDKAYEIYKSHGGNITNREIANILEEDEKVIAVWKQRDKWNNKMNVVQQSNQSCTTLEKDNNKGKRGAPKGNQNAVGNSGGSAPIGNDNALVHGLFAKFLPKRTIEIAQIVQDRSPIDMLWDMITIKYGSIIASQEIMYVESKQEMIKELKKKKFQVVETGNGEVKQIPTEEEWEFQFAWERQATFLNAQSRAMAELRNQIKDYEELCKSDMATEEQKLRIEKLKVEIDKIKQDKGNANKEPIEITIVRKKGDEQ